MTPGTVVGWRRRKGGQVVAHGFGVVRSYIGGMVELEPWTGSTSHRLRRPFEDVRPVIEWPELYAELLRRDPSEGA
ncbi:MAG: hypothetical protein GEV08_21070 [Acidimicrobiia bacterium]|nr:hypothetical protein [Acidimicrobiia bacterium]